MQSPRNISISDFDYELPAERIPKYPLPERGSSKLLVWRDGKISDHEFKQLPELLPPGSLLVLNDSKVIHARLFFETADGVNIEIFCLEPEGPEAIALSAQHEVQWRCLVGRLKKWKEPVLMTSRNGIALYASIAERRAEVVIIHFRWEPADKTFAEVLEVFGQVPIPPYLEREAEEIDERRYQTVYAKEGGSVAAPTAGLHFTPEILSRLEQQGIIVSSLQLHVGSGTFRPVKAQRLDGHQMHGEFFSVSRKFIETLLCNEGKQIIAVGTTSLRALESLYWSGVRMLREKLGAEGVFEVSQWEPYEQVSGTRPADALAAIIRHLDRHALDHFGCRTSLLIAPPYKLRVTRGLVTNFHQPRSTLLLLVAAVTGGDWKTIYSHALARGYRFLSYGDSSLLLPKF